MPLYQKQPRLELSPADYAVVQKQVLQRDGWRCQECGAMKELQVHHITPRSRLGPDAMENLITLCAGCHGQRHSGRC